MKTLILLHGAIGASDQLQRFTAVFENQYERVLLFDFPGHGGKAFPEKEFGIPLFAASLIDFMNAEHVQQADVFGYSMGGYVALYAAAKHEGRIGKIMTLGTKFAWDPATAEKEVKMLNPEKIQEKVPAFAEALKKRHCPEDWRIVLDKTADMMRQLGQAPALNETLLRAIQSKVLIAVGDRDTMVSIEESLSVFRNINDAHFAVLPGWVHPIEKADAKKLGELFSGF
ncbi:MAG: hypothetical protein Fur0041_15060 [Bacteroidia bacterium]